jgi:hypothetical protein
MATDGQGVNGRALNQQEPAMFRNSITVKLAFATLALGLATLASTPKPAAALGITIGGGFCPAGTHPGYEDKYCWPNRSQVCPPGTHLGYEGKYCWANRY